MTKYIQGKDGKFAGSIGDGKTSLPSASDLPKGITPAMSDVPADASYADVYAAYAAQVPSGRLDDHAERLEVLGLNRADLPAHVTDEDIEEALDTIDEAADMYTNSPHYPGSSDYDPAPEGMVYDAVKTLGLTGNEARALEQRIFDSWEWAPDYSGWGSEDRY